MSRNIPSKLRSKIVGKQRYRCNNRPGVELRNLKNFECKLWKDEEYLGSFDENGYEIDHIVEYVLTQDDSEENLQALCVNCHREKTKRFMKQRYVKRTATKAKKIEKIFSCEKCSKSFTSQNGLNYHTRNNVCETMGKYICQYCDKHLSSSYSLYRHKKTCKKRIEEERNATDSTDDSITEIIDNNDILARLSEMEDRIRSLEIENSNLKSTVFAKRLAPRNGRFRKAIKHK